MTLSLTAPVFDLPDGAMEFIEHVHAQPINDWHRAPLSKKGKQLRGDTAAGQAIETMLKIAVNNSDGPDIPRGRIEVKAGRVASECPTTLLTKAPCFPKGANRQMVTHFGYPCENDPAVTRLMISIGAARSTLVRNAVEFNLNISDELFTLTANNIIVAGYNKSTLLARVEKKLGGMLAHFEADRRFASDGVEEFKINSLNLYWGYDENKFWDCLQKSTIVVEPRLKLEATGKCRDRGTAFRSASPSDLYRFSHKVI